MLTLLRHAKSDYPLGVADHDRPLSHRGRRDAPVAGQVLSRGPAIGLVLVSDAVRAQQTWDLAAASVPDAPVRTENRLYHASPLDIIEVISEVPDDVGHVVVVGHNPGLEEVALMLARPDDSPGYDALCAKYPTSAIAVLVVDGPWADVSGQFRRADLVQFTVPRG